MWGRCALPLPDQPQNNSYYIFWGLLSRDSWLWSFFCRSLCMQMLHLFLLTAWLLRNCWVLGDGAPRRHRLACNTFNTMGVWRKAGSPAARTDWAQSLVHRNGFDKYSRSLKSPLWVWAILGGEDRVLQWHSPILPRWEQAESQPGINVTLKWRRCRSEHSQRAVVGRHRLGAPGKEVCSWGGGKLSVLILFSLAPSPPPLDLPFPQPAHFPRIRFSTSYQTGHACFNSLSSNCWGWEGTGGK